MLLLMLQKIIDWRSQVQLKLKRKNLKGKEKRVLKLVYKYRQICPLSEQQYHFSIAYDEFEAYGSNRRENYIPHYKSFKDSIHINIPVTDLSNSSISQSQPTRSNQVRINFAYGDILGNTYVKSLERFTENMSDSIKEFVFDYINAITEGGHSLAKATECLMEKNSSIIENFIPPSKKIKLNYISQCDVLNQNKIVKKENEDIEMCNISEDIPLKLTPYEVKQIENIINNIIIKKNYEYEQKEMGLMESIIRDNHIDYLSVIQREKISEIIKDIFLKHNETKFNINNQTDKLVSDKLIKSYLESNITELKIYHEMKCNLKSRDLKKETELEYNIQKRFLEMLNISSNYGIDKINKENEIQLKKLEQEILLRKKLEQENLKKQQELEKKRLEQKMLEQERAKQKDEALKKQKEELEKLKQKKERELTLQQKQVKNRQEIEKQLELQLKEHQEQLLKQKQEQLLKQKQEQLLKQKQEQLLKQKQEQLLKQKQEQLLKQKQEQLLKQKQEQLLKQKQEQLLKQKQHEQLLRQRLEQQKINANQPTQFDPKNDS
eukprot:jgi/Orpsp1_1/1182229/evm.model.c7180000080419.1